MDIIKLKFKATECNGWPSAYFLIDDDLYQDHQFSAGNEIIDLPIDLIDGDHRLDIELYGKTEKNTKLIDNEIVQDQLLGLEDIFINDIKLPDFFKYNSVYRADNKDIKQALTWGRNGVWSWNFSVPIITWAINFKQSYQFQFDNIDKNEIITIKNTPAKISETSKALDRLENILKNG